MLLITDKSTTECALYDTLCMIFSRNIMQTGDSAIYHTFKIQTHARHYNV